MKSSTADLRYSRTATSGSLAVTVNDDGVGIGEVTGEGSFGLIGMEERARMVNGKLSIAAQPSHGTRIALKVPLHASCS